MKELTWLKKSGEKLEKYKYVLLAVLVGMALLAWPTGGEERSAPEAAEERWEDPLDTGAAEEKLEQTLSRIEGAGRVRVMLTLARTPRQVLAQDGMASGEGDSLRRETTTVLVSRGTGQQEPAVLQVMAPEYRGAVVVSQGGDDPRVRLALSEAVSALTGLGADKISICKGK